MEDKTGARISLATGGNYKDIIDKFHTGYYDFGFIGPGLYSVATIPQERADNFRILAGLETNNKPFYHSVIIADRNNTSINGLDDLTGKKFAFGTRQSKFSCYLPCKMLLDTNMFDTLAGIDFVGRYETIIEQVLAGDYDVGAVKESVAQKYLDEIKIIARSEPVYDYLMIAHKNMDLSQYAKIKQALLDLKAPDILKSIRSDVTGFIPTSDKNYADLRNTIMQVDKKLASSKPFPTEKGRPWPQLDFSWTEILPWL